MYTNKEPIRPVSHTQPNEIDINLDTSEISAAEPCVMKKYTMKRPDRSKRTGERWIFASEMDFVDGKR